MAAMVRALSKRLRGIACEFAKFGVVGVTGVFIANAVYDLLDVRYGVGPVTSATVATVVAAVATYLGNRYWSFRRRQRTAVAREVLVFAVLNGVGLLIQDATVAFNSYLLHLGHNRLAAFLALNLGIALATLFRFWSYRRFVWSAPPAPGADAGQPGDRVLQGLPARRGPAAVVLPLGLTPDGLAGRRGQRSAGSVRARPAAGEPLARTRRGDEVLL